MGRNLQLKWLSVNCGYANWHLLRLPLEKTLTTFSLSLSFPFWYLKDSWVTDKDIGRNRLSEIVLPPSVTRLGYFWKVFGTKFPSNVAQVFGDFWSYLEWHKFLSKNWATFGTSWATFYSNIWSHCCNVPS